MNTPHAADPLKLKDLVALVLEEHRDALAGIPQGKALLIAREVLRRIREQVGESGEGSLMVQGLGQFKTRAVEPRDGQPAGPVRRTLFVAQRPRQPLAETPLQPRVDP